MSAAELRERIGHRPWINSDGPDIKMFLIKLADECKIHDIPHRFAFHVVEEMSDEELLVRWARHMIERNSE